MTLMSFPHEKIGPSQMTLGNISFTALLREELKISPDPHCSYKTNKKSPTF